MAQLRLRCLQSPDELRASATAWDDLWLRSGVTLPTARAEVVAHWVETLAAHRPFHAVVVEDAGRFVAAIPLMSARIKRLFKAARLPCNSWSWAGDLLLDPDATSETLDRLIDGILELPLPFLWFDGVPLGKPHWQRFLDGLSRRGIGYARHERFRIGVVDLAQDWAAYQSAWSGNFRRQMRKMTRRADELGGVTLTVHRPSTTAELEERLQAGFEVENRSWKGQNKTSVLQSPSMHRYLRELAETLADPRKNHLELYFLEFEGKPIAFEYGLFAKGTYFSPKVGYDEAYSHLSPGQLLRLKMMERFFADDSRHSWDFLGPLVEATERWTTSSYPIERLVVATGGVSAQLALRAYRDWWPAMRRLRDHWRGNGEGRAQIDDSTDRPALAACASGPARC